MATRSVEPSYYDHGHHRPEASWTTASPYSEVMPAYEAQQRNHYPSRPQLSHPRPNSSLPPLRDLTGGPDPSYPPPTGMYTHSYSNSASTPTAIENGSFPSERSYYETAQRYGQSYSQASRPHAPVSTDYYRYPSTAVPYQPPTYGSVDYSSSSIVLPHPVSPTVTDSDSRNRRRRGNLPKPITDLLRGWFHEHLDHPYPTEEDKMAFVAQTGLTVNQISNWFINARRRHLPALRQARDRNAHMTNVEYDADPLRRTHHH